MEILASNTLLRDVNVFRTVYYPTDLMLYFEKHHIFEILFDLMVLVGQKRPLNIRDFMAFSIGKIAEKYQKVDISVECPINNELETFASVFSKVHKSPVIAFQKPVSRKRIRKLVEQLNRFGLKQANVIFIGKKDEIPVEQISEDFHLKKCIDLTKSLENSTHLDIKSILSVAVDLKQLIKQLSTKPQHEHVKYVDRILMIGRPGSGTHLQAKLLANRLGLILVSAKELVKRARSVKNCFKRTLEIGLQDNVHTSELIATIVQKRLLEPDCLQFGWVLIDYPYTAQDVENLYNLLIVPLRVIHLHVNARLCRKRKFNHIEKQSHTTEISGDIKESMLQAEFDYFELHHSAMFTALENQHCVVIDINGHNDVESVHEEILTKLLRI